MEAEIAYYEAEIDAYCAVNYCGSPGVRPVALGAVACTLPPCLGQLWQATWEVGTWLWGARQYLKAANGAAAAGVGMAVGTLTSSTILLVGGGATAGLALGYMATCCVDTYCMEPVQHRPPCRAFWDGASASSPHRRANMDSSFLPTLGWIIVAIVTLVLWRSEPMMARIGVMGASGSLGIWLLQRDWTLVGGGLLGVGVVLAVVTGRVLFRGPPSLKHPLMVLGVSTLVMLVVVGVGVPYIDDARLGIALIVVLGVVAAAFLITTLVTTFRVVREQLRLRARTR